MTPPETTNDDSGKLALTPQQSAAADLLAAGASVTDSSFRAMVRDALNDEIEAAFPFPKVQWPEKIVPGPSPFTAEERDQILEYFRHKRWKVGGFNDNKPHYPYFAFLYTLFFTGMRPSEAVAVRVTSVYLRARTIYIDRSRHLGEEAPPKTQRSRRAVRLTADNAEILEPLLELKARPEHYFFKNVRAASRSRRRTSTISSAMPSGR